MKKKQLTLGDLTVYLEDLLRLGFIEESITEDGKLGYKITPAAIRYVKEHPEEFKNSVD